MVGSWKPGGKSPGRLVHGSLFRSLQDGGFLEAWWSEVSRMVGSWKPGGQKSPGWWVLGSLVVRSLQDGWFLEAWWLEVSRMVCSWKPGG
jgi:hypothetical protein